MAAAWSGSNGESTVSAISIRLKGRAVAKAAARQQAAPSFDQAALSRSRVLIVGAGGIGSPVALMLARQGIGGLTIVDGDTVEASNLSRQRFFAEDIGRNKAMALAGNIERECIYATAITGHALMFEDALERGLDLTCDLAICGVDNNPGRVAVSRFSRARGKPAIFVAVSADCNHGYVFVQEAQGACLGCLYPDMINDQRYPCPGTPAVADILGVVAALAVYAAGSLVMGRPRNWNYRRVYLPDGASDASALIPTRVGCAMFDPDGFNPDGREHDETRP